MATGFTHDFGGYAGNRALVRWMREQNRDRPPAERLHFVGFDAPVEWTDVPDPRPVVQVLHDFLTGHTDVPTWHDDLRAYTDDLRWILVGELPRLRREADPDALEDALLAARTAAGIFAYGQAMNLAEDRRWQHAANIRDTMMAENLEAIARRAPTLVFAHNQHLRTGTTEMTLGPVTLRWQPAGAHLVDRLGPAYHVIACAVGDAPGTPPAPENTVEGLLHRDLPPGHHLLSASALQPLRSDLVNRKSENFAYIPLDGTVLDEVAQVLFLHAV
jgi:erythromycin esterase